MGCPSTSVLLHMLDYLRKSFNKVIPINNKTIANDNTRQCKGMCVCVCVERRGIVWFGAKYFDMLSLCHLIISVPNQSSSDISSDVLYKIILSPAMASQFQF